MPDAVGLIAKDGKIACHRAFGINVPIGPEEKLAAIFMTPLRRLKSGIRDRFRSMVCQSLE